MEAHTAALLQRHWERKRERKRQTRAPETETQRDRERECAQENVYGCERDIERKMKIQKIQKETKSEQICSLSLCHTQTYMMAHTQTLSRKLTREQMQHIHTHSHTHPKHTDKLTKTLRHTNTIKCTDIKIDTHAYKYKHTHTHTHTHARTHTHTHTLIVSTTLEHTASR